MRLMRQSHHVKSCDIELRFDIDATRCSERRELALQIEVNVAWYHMIALRINLMNISAVTIFLAKVGVFWRTSLRPAGGDPGLDHLKIFFWQLLFPWVDLALLKPMKNFPWNKCVRQATKIKAKSCSFLDAIRRCSCGPSADWLKIDGRENPFSTLETGWYATVRFAAPSSFHQHFEYFLSLLSAWAHLRKKSCPLSTVDPSKSLQSLSSKFILSSRSLDFCVQHVEVELRAGRGQRRCCGCGIENEARGSSAGWAAPANIAECCHHIQVSRDHTAGSGWFKSKKKKMSRAFPGILQCGPAFWPTTWLLNDGNFCWVRVTAAF